MLSSGLLFLIPALSPMARAAYGCPAPYDNVSITCQVAPATPVCWYLTTDYYKCDLDIAGGTGPAELYAFNDSAGTPFYHVWGTDANGTDFCCFIAVNNPDDVDSKLVVHGGAGADYIKLENYGVPGWSAGPLRVSSSVNGLGGNDTIIGGSALYEDELDGGNNNDTIWGGPGYDHIIGGASDDELHGGTGGDYIEGFSGIDTIFGDAGNDGIDGGVGNDIISGGDNNDTISGGDDIDDIAGDAGDDSIAVDQFPPFNTSTDDGEVAAGGAGVDTIHGAQGADVLYGDGENDHIYGYGDADDICGDDDDDYLDGGQGNNDEVYGGTGTTTILGGSGTGDYCEATPIPVSMDCETKALGVSCPF
jgi:Ca2+-binding RTX toxin-like protein